MQRVQKRIIEVKGNIAAVEADDSIGIGDIATVNGEPATVIELDKGVAYLQLLEGSMGVPVNTRIVFTQKSPVVSASDAMIGRIFDGLGNPIDNRGEVKEEKRSIYQPSINPTSRKLPDTFLETGIPMIDVFNSLARSQKIPIFTVAGEPFNELMMRIALQAQADLIVIGGIGMLLREFAFYKTELEKGGALNKTTFFAHLSHQSSQIAMMVPDRCLTFAEAQARKGKNVLVLMSDYTKYADAMKEVAITMERIPSNRSYPGDLYTMLAKTYERAVDFRDAGSVSIITVTTMPGDDVTHPVPDNTGYITEGQFYLKGGKVQLQGSLSRLKQLVNKDTREDHRDVMTQAVQFYAEYLKAQERAQLGFGLDQYQKNCLHFGELFEERIMDLAVSMPLIESLDSLWDIFGQCFSKDTVRIKSAIKDKYWPRSAVK
ncbi:MAG: V-type ATP synthase subunit B [Deltaproteobacteria bacterium]|nr:V-type ATP synthase subunit B [Deltaproteobacteria bacterium]